MRTNQLVALAIVNQTANPKFIFKGFYRNPNTQFLIFAPVQTSYLISWTKNPWSALKALHKLR